MACAPSTQRIFASTAGQVADDAFAAPRPSSSEAAQRLGVIREVLLGEGLDGLPVEELEAGDHDPEVGPVRRGVAEHGDRLVAPLAGELEDTLVDVVEAHASPSSAPGHDGAAPRTLLRADPDDGLRPQLACARAPRTRWRR